MSNFVDVLKNNDEDFEWYPTTDEIIQKMNRYIKEKLDGEFNRFSFLDIGAGDGRVLDSFENSNKLYAIEKSLLLIEKMSKNIMVIGTDFLQQTLLDKKVDIIFSNPDRKSVV